MPVSQGHSVDVTARTEITVSIEALKRKIQQEPCKPSFSDSEARETVLTPATFARRLMLPKSQSLHTKRIVRLNELYKHEQEFLRTAQKWILKEIFDDEDDDEDSDDESAELNERSDEELVDGLEDEFTHEELLLLFRAAHDKTRR